MMEYEPSPIPTTPEPWWVRRLPFKSTSAGVKMVASAIALVVLVKMTDWRILFIGAAAFVLTYLYESWRRRRNNRYLLEVRMQGQFIKHTPQKFRVPHSKVRLWAIPQELYEGAITFGDHRPPFNTGGLVVCDYYDPYNNVIVFPEDANWSNFALLAHSNDELAEHIRRIDHKKRSIEHLKQEVAKQWSANLMSDEEAFLILEEANEEAQKLAMNPRTARSLFLYYKDAIPKLQQQLMDLWARFNERSHQMGAAYATWMHGLPLKPELFHILNQEDGDDNDLIRPDFPDYREDDFVDDSLIEDNPDAESLPQGMHTMGQGSRRRG